MGEKYHVKEFVENKIQNLLNERDTGRGKAALANLRRGVGKMPGEFPEIWRVFLEKMPEAWMRKDGVPSREEWSIYITLTMFALHQQGRYHSMQLEGESLGKAIRKLVDEEVEGDEKRVLRRFNPLVTATDMVEVSYHLRGLIQLLRSKELPLDYGMLAEDLFLFQIPERQSRVQLRWGQDFYRNNTKNAEGEKL